MFETVGTFAPVWAEWMKAYYPKKWAALQGKGTAEGRAREFEERALTAFHGALSALRRAHPRPEHFLEAVQHGQNLRAMARELILADLLPSPVEGTHTEP